MPGRSSWPVAAPVLALLAVGVLAGCGASAGAKPAGPGASSTPGPVITAKPVAQCGTARTAAGVPVEIEIEHGSVPCAAAMAVERGYARALASGKVPGNGGGAPATVRGWVCRGFATPQLLATGQTSTCSKGSDQILAVLQMPAPSASPS
ncbi:MAG TPA: hypothetical protein VMV17_12885 [Streptosporangiaceae bacterium]|nr:hypothetical protein [Streptosporangiaceae bacterium]